MHAVKLPCYSIEQYLETERDGEQRHEYLNGEIIAMTGGSLAHNLITGNLFSALRAHLRGTPCRAYVNDVKVRVEAANCFFYPDVLVSCLETTRLDNCYFVNDAQLIVEVLSPSTRQRDREFKRFAYQQLPGLREYLLVAQDRRQVVVYHRLPDGWEQLTYSAGETVKLDGIGLALPLSQIYEDVPDDLLAGNE